MPPKISMSAIPSWCRRSVPSTTSDASSKSTAMLGLSFRISARMAGSTALGSDPDIDTVVEPLVPAPVNGNTASAAVLTALFSEVRIKPGVDPHSYGVQGSGVAPISRGQARELADAIVTLRTEERGTGTPGGPTTGPFEGWRDVAARLKKPRLDAASTSAQKAPWIVLYRNLLTGRDSVLEMGTAPICFVSGPWVGYRAAASRSTYSR